MFVLSLIYLALTIVRPQDYLPGLAHVPILSVVLVVAFLGWLVSSAKTFAAPQFAILPAFLLVTMISQATNGWVGGMVDQFGLFAPAVVIYFVLAAGCTRREHVVTTMKVFVLCATVLAVHGIQQAITGVGWTGTPIGEDNRIVYVGIFHDPNDLGLLFVAVLPMAAYLTGRSRFLGKLLWLACALLLLYGVYLTNSRGAFLGVLMVGGVYIWRHRGPVVAGTLGVVGLTVMKLLSSRMNELDPEESSAYGRVDAWYAGLEMFRSHPLFGVGAGNFTDYNDLTAHNSFVLVLAETGFTGFVLWLAFVGYAFLQMRAVLGYRPPAEAAPAVAVDVATDQRLAMTLLLSLCGLFTCAYFLSRSYTIVLYMQAALVGGFYVGARERLPGLPTFRFADAWGRWVAFGMAGVVFLHVLVAVLLRLA